MRILLITLAVLMCTALTGQQTEEKKVRIKKIVEKDGEKTTEVIEATGEEADKILLEMRENGEFENIDLESMEGGKVRIIKKGHADAKLSHQNGNHSHEESLEVEKSVDKDGNITSLYTLTQTNDGEVKVIKWDGEGEPPAEIKSAMEKTEVNTIVVDEDNVWVTKEGGKTELDKKQYVFKNEEKEITPNKASLGVMIKDDGYGVVVEDVVKGSGADSAGLESDDIILKINREYVFSMQGLLDKLKPYEGGESIEITYIRDGKENTTKAKMKAAK